MEFLLQNPHYLTILGLLITLTGIYKLHLAIKFDNTSKVTFHNKESHDAAIIDFYQAKSGLRYTLYGFLIQALTVIF
jgi:hypothetical protein